MVKDESPLANLSMAMNGKICKNMYSKKYLQPTIGQDIDKKNPFGLTLLIDLFISVH